jgi:hypothetical protein
MEPPEKILTPKKFRDQICACLKYRLMFQQLIPRLLPDSDIATYGGQFILIEHRLWPILDRGCNKF